MIGQSEREQKQEAKGAQRQERKRLSKQLARRAEQPGALRHTGNMLEYLHTLLSAKASKWDTHPWLLGTRQGVIDLRTGTVRAGQPDDHLRTIIPTVWKGLDEPAPRFQQFLREIFSDRQEKEREELIAFLQRALGYGITGNVNEHIFLMLYGEEEYSGKEVLIHILEHVLGRAVGAVAGNGEGLSAASGNAQAYLSSLQGKRLAWISEGSREPRLDSEQIKQLTGEDLIVVRQFYAREHTFTPTHLLLLLASHRLQAPVDDSAFWERLCPLILTLRFVEKPEHTNERQRDPHLSAALEAEASGILAWLVRGSLEWARLGLAIPESVLQARQEHRAAKNTIQDFVRQCCFLQTEARIPANQLYKRYKQWAGANGTPCISNKRFAHELKQAIDITWQRSRHGNIYKGIGLQKEIDAAD